MLWLNILLQSYIFISDAVTNEHIKLLQCFLAVFAGDHFIEVELLTEEGRAFGELVICRISLYLVKGLMDPTVLWDIHMLRKT